MSRKPYEGPMYADPPHYAPNPNYPHRISILDGDRIYTHELQRGRTQAPNEQRHGSAMPGSQWPHPHPHSMQSSKNKSWQPPQYPQARSQDVARYPKYPNNAQTLHGHGRKRSRSVGFNGDDGFGPYRNLYRKDSDLTRKEMADKPPIFPQPNAARRETKRPRQEEKMPPLKRNEETMPARQREQGLLIGRAHVYLQNDIDRMRRQDKRRYNKGFP